MDILFCLLLLYHFTYCLLWLFHFLFNRFIFDRYWTQWTFALDLLTTQMNYYRCKKKVVFSSVYSHKILNHQKPSTTETFSLSIHFSLIFTRPKQQQKKIYHDHCQQNNIISCFNRSYTSQKYFVALDSSFLFSFSFFIYCDPQKINRYEMINVFIRNKSEYIKWIGFNIFQSF